MRDQQDTKEVSSEEEIIDSILENLPTETSIDVEVPSLGKFYSDLGEGSTVKIRPMTFEDEKALSLPKRGKLDPIEIILSRCVENIDYRSLYLMDKLFLILKIREISFGDDYNSTITCPGCGRDNPLTFTLSQLPINFVKDDFADEHELELPTIRKKVKIRFPTVADEKFISASEDTPSYLWRFITEIDGNSSKKIIAKIIKKLPLKDLHTITNDIFGTNYGIQTKVKFICENCNVHHILNLPIGEDFFSVT